MKGHGDDEQDNEDQWSFSSTEDEVGSSTRDDLERDEVQEVHKTQRKDTRRLRLWRFVVTGVLLVTALAVTLTTYRFLQDEQQNNFKTAVRIIVKAADFSQCTGISKSMHIGNRYLTSNLFLHFTVRAVLPHGR
jgi:uncharacterized membrane protein YcjF (UPF0283 family)